MPGHASSFAELEAHEQRRARATRWLLAALGLCAGQLMLWLTLRRVIGDAGVAVMAAIARREPAVRRPRVEREAPTQEGLVAHEPGGMPFCVDREQRRGVLADFAPVDAASGVIERVRGQDNGFRGQRGVHADRSSKPCASEARRLDQELGRAVRRSRDAARLPGHAAANRPRPVACATPGLARATPGKVRQVASKPCRVHHRRRAAGAPVPRNIS